MSQYGVILFYTTSAVLKAEKLLVKQGFSIKLVPTPRQFSSDCGIAIRFEWYRYENLQYLLNGEKIEFNAIHSLDNKGN